MTNQLRQTLEQSASWIEGEFSRVSPEGGRDWDNQAASFIVSRLQVALHNLENEQPSRLINLAAFIVGSWQDSEGISPADQERLLQMAKKILNV